MQYVSSKAGSPRNSGSRSSVQELLADAWRTVLCRESIGIHDNFFDLGGDSIAASRIVAQLKEKGVELTSAQLLEHQTIAQLSAAAHIVPGSEINEGAIPSDMDRCDAKPAQHGATAQVQEKSPTHSHEKDEDGAIEDTYPLTPLQEAMHFHILDARNGEAYLNQQMYTLRGEINVAAFKRAYELLIGRHTNLRTAFRLDPGGTPLQVVYRHMELPWEQYDWRRFSQAEQTEKLNGLLQAEQKQYVELDRLPLMRLVLIRMEDDSYEFIWSYYLILLDGWSVNILLSEALSIYDALVQQRPVKLPAPIPFRKYIEWLQARDAAAAEKYWQRTLQGFSTPTVLEEERVFPTTKLQESGEQERFQEAVTFVDEATTAALRAFCRQHRLTMNTLVQGAWALHLARHKGSEDVMFGSVAAGRPVDIPRVDSMVGIFINTLPVRVRIQYQADLLSWLRALQAQQAEARNHEFLSLAQLQRFSDVPRGQEMFESVIIFQNFPSNIAQLASLKNLKVVDAKCIERNSFAITLVIEPSSGLLFRMVYERRRFHESTISRILDQLLRLLQQMLANPNSPVGSFSAVAETERKQLIQSFNQSLEC